MRARFLFLGLPLALVLLAAACGDDAPTPTSAPPSTTPTPHMVETPTPETREVRAPIDGVELNIAESDPPQYFLEIQAGLPNACHTFDRKETQRSGTEITVTVVNRVVTSDVGCAEIYITETHSVALGSDFEPGATYTVRVNDETLTFTAESASATTATPRTTLTAAPAPIERVDLYELFLLGAQHYVLDITSGLPDACHTFDRIETQRGGTDITVSVINSVISGDVACAQVYGTEINVVALGSDFEVGVTYTIRVNEWEESFTPEALWDEVEAPIADVGVQVVGPDPVQYFLDVRAGVPDTCHAFDRIETQREGTEITVSVINRVLTRDGECTEIQRVAPHSIALGGDLEPGTTYTVLVNDREISFTPEAAPVEVDAPIENVTVHPLKTDPPQYFLEIQAGLPDACHTFGRTEVQRSGSEITVSVINLIAVVDAVCGEVYETAPHLLPLGTDFEAGVTYTVRVNDWETSFTAEAVPIEMDAPIEEVELLVLETDPPQYFLEVTSGLPDACHTFDRIETERTGTEITVTVINRVATGDVMCAQVYETVSNTVELGSEFEAGVTYTVRVNDETLTFTTE